MCSVQGRDIFRAVMAMAPSLPTLDRPRVRAWCGTYPPKGGTEALATITERDGGFDVWVTAVGWALKGHGVPTRASQAATLEAAQSRADALAAELLDRDVSVRWHEASAEDL
jgi:hypothetical protein